MWTKQTAVGKPILEIHVQKDYRIIDSRTALINAEVLVKCPYNHLLGDDF